MENSPTITHIDKRLARVQSLFSDFFAIANLGDLNSVYRGKPIWANYQTEEICRPVENLLSEVPAARNAVLYFISNLVHENVYLHLLEGERKDATTRTVDFRNLNKAVQQLTSNLQKLNAEADQKSSLPLTLLNMLFELFSDLYRLNCHRPFFSHQRPSPINFLRAFQQIPCIVDLFTLLDSTFSSLLSTVADKAVFTLVTAHKIFFTNFEWVAIQIAETFPSNIAGQLMKVGSDEFCNHCNDLLNPSVRSNQSRVIQLQEEYNTRLSLFADIFQYMGQKRKIELRSCFISIVENFLKMGENWREFLFLTKISLYSPDIILTFDDELLQVLSDEPFLVERIFELSENPALSIAVSPTNLLQIFFHKLVEKANTAQIFKLIRIISPFI